jgi:hypothetical protein
MNAQKLGSSQQDGGVVGVALEEEAAQEVAASREMHNEPGAKHTIGGGMEFGGKNRGLGTSGVPPELISASSTTAEQFFVGLSSKVAIQAAAAAKRCGAVRRRFEVRWKRSWDGREWRPNGAYAGVYSDSRAGPRGARSVVAVQAVAAVKGNNAGAGSCVRADVTKA